MSTKLVTPPRSLAPIAGAAALVAWSAALFQALPRLMAGPLCSARSDPFSFAGHCPACFVAVGLTLVFLASLTSPALLARAIPIGRPSRR